MFKILNLKSKLGAFMMLVVLIMISGIYVSADSSTKDAYTSSGYTATLGPSKTATFKVWIASAGNGAYEARIKDPNLWHVRRSDNNLKKGYEVSFTRTEGSKDAKWDGWIKNGSIKVTVPPK